MSNGRTRWFLAVFAAAAMQGSAQAPATTPVVIDAAVQDKANAGDAAAEVKVGEAYAAGNGTQRDARQLAADLKQAAAWYQKAADQGNPHRGDSPR